MVVDKYVKALIQAVDKDELIKIYEAISKLAAVAKEEKFILLVKSPIISIDEKVKILKQITGCESKHFENFMRILLENKRIDLLKDIAKRLYAEISNLMNVYEGVVEGKVSDITLKALEVKLSKKFNAEIKLAKKDVDVNGIRVYVNVLDVEVSILEDRIKQNLISQILKAI
jgi:F-type H+-transporting ATPase subunit delta